MRKMIKFRGKCAGIWCMGDHLTYSKSEVIKQWSGSISPEYNVDSETVGQFTGMYDNAGKEIYEDDILQSIPFPEVTGRVVKHHGCWIIQYGYEEEDDDFNLLYDVLRDFGYYVIGNAFDNPEFIEGSAKNENK